MNQSYASLISVSHIAAIVAGSAFLIALSLGTIFSSLMCRLSWRWGAIDRPDGTLKCHNKPTATLGGVPVFFAIVAASSVLFVFGRALRIDFADLFGGNLSLGALLLSSAIILSLGISDDLRRVVPRTKLLFQMLAATILIGSGLVIHRCDLSGVVDFSLGSLAVPFTLFWLVGSCNAFNFIDGMDGLASGLGVVMATFLGVMAFLTGSYSAAVISFAVSGALLSILLFNIKPAVLFLGDSGSQLTGLLLGALAIHSATAGGVFALCSAGLILSVPIVDAFMSILRRYSKSESPALGDHHHIHHRLVRLGINVRSVSAILWSVTFLAGAIGIFCYRSSGSRVFILVIAFVLAELYLAVRLGCVNFDAFFSRLVGCYRWCSTPLGRPGSVMRKSELEVLWERLEPLFENMHLDRAVLTLEGVGEDGLKDYETYQWARSEALIAELESRWTRQFKLDDDQHRTATLELEAGPNWRTDEERLDWLLKQIRENVRFVSLQDRAETIGSVRELAQETANMV